MTRDETIRVEYTYLLQKVQSVETICGLIDQPLRSLWSDIKNGCMTTECTAELKRWINELQAKVPEIMGHVDAIEHEIKQLSTEDQIRMKFKG